MKDLEGNKRYLCKILNRQVGEFENIKFYKNIINSLDKEELSLYSELIKKDLISLLLFNKSHINKNYIKRSLVNTKVNFNKFICKLESLIYQNVISLITS